MEALYLKSQKISHQKICQICRITRATLIKYLKQYQNEGIEGLKKWLSRTCGDKHGLLKQAS